MEKVEDRNILTERDFITIFRVYKNIFLNENDALKYNLKPLDIFEKWLQKNTEEPKSKEPSTKINNITLNKYLVEIVAVAKNLLFQKGVQITCISFGKSIDYKDAFKCVCVFKKSNIYYRIGRTSPRKGKYSKQDLLVIELVMDGNKKRVFAPMIIQKEAIEKQLGFTIERELPQLEATGRYRFKLYFSLDEMGNNDQDFLRLGRIFADFIYVTMGYLHELKVV